VRWKTGISLLVVLLALYGWTKTSVDHRVQARKNSTDIRYLPTPQMMSFLSFGYKQFFADLYWIEALNYFGSKLTTQSKKESELYALNNSTEDPGFTYLSNYADLILSLDPYFVYFYEWSSTIFIYNWMPSSKQSIEKSNYYGKQGILNLAKVHRFSPQIIEKTAFNYAIESKEYSKAAELLLLLSRVSAEKRDIALVAATYFDFSGQSQRAKDAREEYLAYSFLENSTAEKRKEAIVLLSSANVNSGAFEFLRAARIEAEKDEDLKALIKKKFSNDQSFSSKIQQGQPLEINPKLQKMFSISMKKTQILNPSLILLLSL